MKVTLVDGDLTDEFLNKCRECGYLGIDSETGGLNEVKDPLACVQVYAEHKDDPECMIIRRFANEPINLIHLINHMPVVKIFHHAPFDLRFMMHNFRDMQPNYVECTKLMAKIYDPDRSKFFDPNKNKHSHTLAALVYTFCNVKLDKTLAVSNWLAPDLTSAQVKYAVNDIRYLPTIYRELISNLNSVQLKDYKLVVQSLPIHIKYKMLYGFNDIYGYD